MPGTRYMGMTLDVRDEFLVADAILVLLRSRLAREQGRELFVEVNKILSILAALEFIL